jgi:ferredoxin-type protein NapF
MGTDIARRDLLRGRLRTPPASIRPPYAIPESEFIERCARCPDCATACAAGIIRLDGAGYPKMQLGNECTFCGDCLKACKTGALDAVRARPWTVKAEISAGCLAVNGIVCRACGDHCGPRAIQFRLMTMGRSQAKIDTAACTGCGACAAVCPSQAISMIDGTAANAVKAREVRGWVS